MKSKVCIGASNNAPYIQLLFTSESQTKSHSLWFISADLMHVDFVYFVYIICIVCIGVSTPPSFFPSPPWISKQSKPPPPFLGHLPLYIGFLQIYNYRSLSDCKNSSSYKEFHTIISHFTPLSTSEMDTKRLSEEREFTLKFKFQKPSLLVRNVVVLQYISCIYNQSQ